MFAEPALSKVIPNEAQRAEKWADTYLIYANHFSYVIN